MDDYEPWLTPCDPDFDPEKCESAYALWAVKEEGEPVKFLEASITDNLDYPSGYWFFWRTISFSEETGRLIEGEWGGAGDICRADYVADMVLPGGAVFARVQGELDDGIPFDWEVRRPLDDCAKTRAAEAISLEKVMVGRRKLTRMILDTTVRLSKPPCPAPTQENRVDKQHLH